MPYYNTMLFGVAGMPAAHATAVALGIQFDPTGFGEVFSGPVLTALDQRLEDIHLDVLNLLSVSMPGFEGGATPALWAVGSSISQNKVPVPWGTPWGLRTVVPISLMFHYDPDECGDSVEDAVLGVALSARYKPSLLDMRFAHGGLEGSGEADDFEWDQCAEPWQKQAAGLAIDLIKATFPVLATGRLLQKRMFA